MESTKIMVVIVIIISALCLSACNNRSYDTNYTYNKAHIRVNDVWFDVNMIHGANFLMDK